ncbi:MAG: exo-alpha-sialidase, partial [Sulfurifustis sp.]
MHATTKSGAFRLGLLLAVISAFASLYVRFAAADRDSGFAVATRSRAPAAEAVAQYENRFASHPQRQSVHSAAAIAVRDGIRGFWYSGTVEGASDTVIATALYSSRDASWGEEQTILTRELTQRHLHRYVRKLGNPVVVRDSRNRIWLFYVSASLGGWSGSAINVVLSDDNGYTWSAPRRLVTSPFFNISTLVKGRPFVFGDGSIGLPVYHEFIGKFGELLRLDPEGRVVAKTRLSWGRHALQPVIVTESPTEAVGFMRYCGKDAGRVLMFSTHDAGKTWSEPVKLALPNPNAAVDAVGLDDHRLLLVFNNRENDRDDLSLAFSPDKGLTWKAVHAFHALAPTPDGARAEQSYPWIVDDQEGRFHLLYTWARQRIRHVEFNSRWVSEQL